DREVLGTRLVGRLARGLRRAGGVGADRGVAGLGGRGGVLAHGALAAAPGARVAASGGLVAHRSRPLIWEVGVASRAAASGARIAASRFTPSGSFWICWCSARIALSSISGRGGHPGR